MSALLAVDGLTGGYGDIQILRGVSLMISEGESVGVLGQNGMGKSTLLKTLMGYLPATAGHVRFDGDDITRLAPFERGRLGIGYVPQGRGIFPHLSVRDNIRIAWNRDCASSDAEEAVANAVADFPRLERLLDRPGGALSGGEQQLLALARCLAAEPSVVLLDEPTEGIQPSIIQEMAETLNRIRKETGLTILVVEQNLEFLTDVCDRLVVMERGEIPDPTGHDASSAEIESFMGFGRGRASSPKPGLPASGVQPVSAQIKSHTPSAAAAQMASPAHRESYMTVRRPTLDQMKDVVRGLHMHLSDEEIVAYMQLMEGSFLAYDRIDQLPDYLPKVKYPRTPGYRPSAAENPMNAWYYKCEVRGAVSGPLEGRKIVLKDNICLAGVPMMNGASTLEGYTPDLDATIVTRILDAGGTIVGKSHCEYFCLSGGSHTNATGPVHNPHRMGHTSGGSSSGSGALVGAGEVEMAIGCDQGGSIRMPAAFCGAYGMKATHGLVPYSGIMPIEITIDHAGPITANVADNALLLEVIAGADGLDPRQYAPRVDKYTQALGRGVSGLRIGIVREGFGWPSSEAEVDRKVRVAADRLRSLGAQVEETSIPMHRDGQVIWTPIALEGLTDLMMHGNGFGTNWEGLYVTSLLDAHSNWRARADELSKTLKISMFVGEYMQSYYRGRFYAKAQNLSRLLRATYDEALKSYDLLLMPTVPMKAPPLPPADAPLALQIQRAFEMIPNTSAFDASGHPAMSVPCGMIDGLPVGMMLIGRFYEESTIYRAAHAFEQSGDWRSM
ncbi:amidase [Mesorhizobium sp. CGMCC 1.15528]|uniref:Indoleacetamide hydrolase n=1 Tax=Mesorhizobium zhangyense TaxID=1776730 RepID=A0A7C9R6W6_9HYPH|nr:amidase [Mesorhizobium zhangyense]NGN41637.1 amidase [Mesorhizobium zhangyense]